jgi:hypothetical protein
LLKNAEIGIGAIIEKRFAFSVWSALMAARVAVQTIKAKAATQNEKGASAPSFADVARKITGDDGTGFPCRPSWDPSRREHKMPITDKPDNNDGLTLLDQKRALEDEIWFWAVAENYAKGRLKGLQSREEVIAKYYAQHPDMKAYVDDHVIGKTCLYGIRELRKREERIRRLCRRSVQLRRQSRPETQKWSGWRLLWPNPIVSTVGRPLPPPPWGIPPDDLDSAIKALPDVPGEQSALAKTPTDAPIYHTGLPGRPTTWFLVDAEVRRRYSPDMASKKTAEWAREMFEWLKRGHPNAPPVTKKTLKNKLASLLRELKAAEK